jgi:hypothetical protein
MRLSVHPGRLRALLAAGAAFAVLGVAPAAARAASVSEAGGTLSYVAAAGEANHVTIAPWGLSLKVTETGMKLGAPIVLSSGTGCWRLSSSSAACAGTAILVNASLGDGDDFIDARDGKVDTIACGAGNDSGNADTVDTVAADCESVLKPADPDPDLPLTDPEVEPPEDPTVTMPVVDPGSLADPVTSPASNAVPPTIPPQTVGVSASGIATVLVVCPPASGGCKGVVTIELPGAADRGHAKVVSAGRGKPATTIGRAKFKAAAGSSMSVPVRLSKRGRQRILRGRRTRARITVTTRSAAGTTSVTTQDVTLRPRSSKRRARRR